MGKPRDVRRAEQLVAQWNRQSSARVSIRRKRIDTMRAEINKFIAWSEFDKTMKLMEKFKATKF